MPILDGQLFVAEESTPGTAVTPAAGDLVTIEAGSSVFQVAGQTEPISRNLIHGYLDRAQPVTPQSRYWALSINTEFKAPAGAPSYSSPTATNPPEIHTLLLCAGMSVDGDADQIDYAWTPDPNGTRTSATVVMEGIGTSPNHYTANGCNFGFSISSTPGERIMWTWTGMGGFNAPAAGSPSSGTINEGIPFVQATDFNIGGYVPGDDVLVIRDWTINAGLSVTPRPDQASAGKFKFPGVLVRDNNVSGSITVEETTVASGKIWDRFTGATDPTDLTVTVGTGLASDTRTCEITIAKAVFGAPQPAQGTPNLWTIPFMGSSEAADDESLMLTFK